MTLTNPKVRTQQMNGETWLCLGLAGICIGSLFGHLVILGKLQVLFGQWKAIVEEDWARRGIQSMKGVSND
jgi:hypothetical protein